MTLPGFSGDDTASDSLDDQRENDRREREIARIASLPLDQQESAIGAEVRRQAEYENTSRIRPLLSAIAIRPNIQHIPPRGSGGFRCEHPGCNTPPFQTHHLLK